MNTPLRPGETAAEALPAQQAGLMFVGCIRTPWTERTTCPRQGQMDGPICRIEIFEPWASGGALDGIEACPRLEVLYWLHLSRRDLLLQRPKSLSQARGTFALRSPQRPNPIGTSIVALVTRDGATLLVRGLDCLDGTHLLDIKPDRGLSRPVTPADAGTAA